MSDLFHEDVPDDYIAAGRPRDAAGQLAHLSGADQALGADARPAPDRRSRDAADAPHIWWGVSVENRQHGLPRIDHLRAAPAGVRFLSVEPLLEDLGADRPGRHPLGDRRRRERPRGPADGADWVASIRDQCQAAGVGLLLQAVGRRPQGQAGRTLDGRTHDESPPRPHRPLPSRAERLAAVAEVEALAEAWHGT